MSKQPQEEHNYTKKMLALVAQGRLAPTVGIHNLAIYHDGWCGIYKGQRCDCDPDLYLGGKKLEPAEEQPK